GVRQASAFIAWVKRRTGPSTVLINSTAQAEALINAEDLAVIGFFKELDNGSVGVFCEAARDVPEMPFGMTASKEVRASYGIHRDTLLVFKKGKPVHEEVLEDSRQSKLDLTRLIKTFTLDLVTEYNLEVCVEGKQLHACPCPQMLFVLVDTSELRNGRVLEYFHIREVDVPAVRILNLSSDAKYKMPAGEVTVENLKAFCQSYLSGRAKLHLSSEEIPEDWDERPVKVLVGKNFNKIVF
ncbi:PDILT protein, partial [Semnornis frantzii]|nr:PDILT protein [Semnornis frantzii]